MVFTSFASSGGIHLAVGNVSRKWVFNLSASAFKIEPVSLAIMNNATMNIDETSFWFILGIYLGVELLGHSLSFFPVNIYI